VALAQQTLAHAAVAAAAAGEALAAAAAAAPVVAAAAAAAALVPAAQLSQQMCPQALCHLLCQLDRPAAAAPPAPAAATDGLGIAHSLQHAVH
jgi:hypothetical protein